MGVRGLWKVIEPTARPVLLESLRGKVLAIDASIWIYHFVKAMRDNSGNLLRAAHIIGFFRRICKLLFYEIKPVFVFDGAAPVLKKQTTKRRRERRADREESARSTANKLLTIQLQRLAEQQADSSRRIPVHGTIPENAHYLDEHAPSSVPGDSSSNSSINPATKNFQGTDQYHLPEINGIAPVRVNDQRMLTEEELDEYSRQFTAQARAGFIDTTLVDFTSREFDSLPLATKYQLLNAARQKSRLRMGYSSTELNNMFPDSMEFSKFQIERVAQRNFFTQRVMNMVGLEDDLTRRVSGEKNREYMLKRNDDEGWTLSLEERELAAQQAILGHDQSAKPAATTTNGDRDVKEESDDEFEDVDLEPKLEPEPLPESQPEPQLDQIAVEADDVQSEGDAAAQMEQIEELFGFEASVQREAHYNKLEPKERTAPVGRPAIFGDNPPPSLLFGGRPKKATSEDKDSEDLPPWFSRPDAEFETMEVTDRSTGNFVPIELADRLRSQKEPEAGKRVFSESEPGMPGPVESAPKRQKSLDPPSPISGQAVPEESPSVEAHVDLTCDANSPVDLTDETEMVSNPPADLAQKESKNRLDGEAASAAAATTLEEPVMDLTEESVERAGPVEPEAIESDAVDPEVVEPEVVEPEAVVPEPIEPEPTHLAEPIEVAAESGEVAQPVEPSKSPAQPAVEDSEPQDKVMSEKDVDLAEADEAADEDEEQDIAEMLIGEAEENERFARSLNRSFLDHATYAQEVSTLRQQFAKTTRDADNVTAEMSQECQELLQMFGIPYITAPMEAEAQCAELEKLGLVDGIVTDDGDCFLFGEVTVYRNMFSQAKFIESYDSKTIDKELGLNRDKLISLAFLLGSDYTDGVVGIGPVIGVELLAEFGNLVQFRDWYEHAQRFPEDAQVTDGFRKQFLKRFGKKLYLAEGFPERAVVQAYEHPVIDPDDTNFEWGSVDLEGLREFLNRTAGWDPARTNEIVLPVVQETKRRELQKKSAQGQGTLDAWVTTKNLQASSKRAAKATRRLAKK